MPEQSVKQIVDAIAADIAAEVPLPEHVVFKYAQQRALRLDDHRCFLQVFPQRTMNMITSTTSEYYDREEIIVKWTGRTFDGAEFNTGDQEAAEEFLETVMAIQERLNEYGSGLPGLFNITAVLHETRYELDRGPAWSAEIELWVEVFRG